MHTLLMISYCILDLYICIYAYYSCKIVVVVYLLGTCILIIVKEVYIYIYVYVFIFCVFVGMINSIVLIDAPELTAILIPLALVLERPPFLSLPFSKNPYRHLTEFRSQVRG